MSILHRPLFGTKRLCGTVVTALGCSMGSGLGPQLYTFRTDRIWVIYSTLVFLFVCFFETGFFCLPSAGVKGFSLPCLALLFFFLLL